MKYFLGLKHLWQLHMEFLNVLLRFTYKERETLITLGGASERGFYLESSSAPCASDFIRFPRVGSMIFLDFLISPNLYCWCFFCTADGHKAYDMDTRVGTCKGTHAKRIFACTRVYSYVR